MTCCPLCTTNCAGWEVWLRSVMWLRMQLQQGDAQETVCRGRRRACLRKPELNREPLTAATLRVIRQALDAVAVADIVRGIHPPVTLACCASLRNRVKAASALKYGSRHPRSPHSTGNRNHAPAITQATNCIAATLVRKGQPGQRLNGSEEQGRCLEASLAPPSTPAMTARPGSHHDEPHARARGPGAIIPKSAPCGAHTGDLHMTVAAQDIAPSRVVRSRWAFTRSRSDCGCC